MRPLTTLLGVGVAIAAMALAAVMNWRYGLRLGRSAEDQFIFATASLVIDLAKVLMPFFVWQAFAGRQWPAGILATIALVGCMSYSITGIAGFVDLARATATGTLKAGKEAIEELGSDLARKQAQLSALAATEPVKAIDRRLAGLRQDARWQSTRLCTDATVAASRAFCKSYRDLEADRSRSAAAMHLEAEISRLRQAIAAGAGVAEIDRGDPQAGILSRVIGWRIDHVQTGLTLLLVGIIEFLSTFGLFIALHHGEKSQPRASNVPAAPMPTEPAQVLPENLVEHDGSDDEHLRQVAGFVLDALQPTPRGRVLIASLYPRFGLWCETYEQPFISCRAFVAAFREACRHSGFRVTGEGEGLIAEGLEPRG